MELRQEHGFPIEQAEAVATSQDAGTEGLKIRMETSNQGDEALIYKDKS